MQSKLDFIIGCPQERQRIMTTMENEKDKMKVLLKYTVFKAHPMLRVGVKFEGSLKKVLNSIRDRDKEESMHKDEALATSN